MKHTATFIFLFGLMVFAVQPLIHSQLFAQFTLNESDFSSQLGTTIETTYYSYDEQNSAALSIIEQVGEDQIWDFSSYAIEDSILGTGTIDFFTNFEGKPGADDPHFSDASLMIEVSIETSFESGGNTQELTFTNYSYSSLSETGFLDFGVASTNSLFEGLTISRSTPARPVYTFPLTYGSMWDYTYDFEVSQDGNTSLGTEYSVDVEVDGYGTVVIGDISIPVLRITETQTDIGSIPQSTSITTNFISSNGFEVASVGISLDPFSDGYLPESGNIQVVLRDDLMSVSSETSPDLPQSVKLDQNFPNPFNPTTQISYQLDTASEVSLSIYSLTGQKVGTLINGEFKQAGEYSVPFDASNLASGIYIYRLRAGDQMFTRKMTLLK